MAPHSSAHGGVAMLDTQVETQDEALMDYFTSCKIEDDTSAKRASAPYTVHSRVAAANSTREGALARQRMQREAQLTSPRSSSLSSDGSSTTAQPPIWVVSISYYLPCYARFSARPPSCMSSHLD